MNDKTETLNAILVELRAAPADAEWNVRYLASRIGAAADREREENGAIIRACMEVVNTLAKERDRAVQYANAAPHPGSASWKEMQSDARKVATLLDSLVEILERTNREKARDYDAALNSGILEIHDIANTAINQIKGE